MNTNETIDLELKTIISRYKEKFEAECDVINNLFDENILCSKYKANLEQELRNIFSNSSMDKKDWYKFEFAIRSGKEDLGNIYTKRITK